jgi:hypothetical protein
MNPSNRNPALQAKVALAAVKGDKTLSKWATHFDIYLSQMIL